MWTLSDRLSPNRSNPGHCLSQAQARALLGLYFLLYKILNFLGPSRKVKLELGLIQPGPFSKFRARALKKWILIWIVLFYKITQEFQVLNGIKNDKMVVMGWMDPKSMGPGPGSGFESQTRAHCDSKILYLLSTALFKIYLHMYINGFSVYLKNIYAYLCFLSCAALLYPIYQ